MCVCICMHISYNVSPALVITASMLGFPWREEQLISQSLSWMLDPGLDRGPRVVQSILTAWNTTLHIPTSTVPHHTDIYLLCLCLSVRASERACVCNVISSFPAKPGWSGLEQTGSLQLLKWLQLDQDNLDDSVVLPLEKHLRIYFLLLLFIVLGWDIF